MTSAVHFGYLIGRAWEEGRRWAESWEETGSRMITTTLLSSEFDVGLNVEDKMCLLNKPEGNMADAASGKKRRYGGGCSLI